MGLVLLFILGAIVLAVAFTYGLVADARHPSRATTGWALGRGIPVDPAAMNLQSSNQHWAHDQPAWRLVGGDADGFTTIIIHGWRRSKIDSLRRIHPWLEASAEVWLLDLDGHGESPDGPTTLGAAAVPALVALVNDRVAATHANNAQTKRVILIGHSLGASIALRAAAQCHSDALAGVVAFAPYESLREPIANRLTARALPAVLFARTAEMCLHALCGGEASTATALKELAARGLPVLLVAAQHDPVVSLDHVQKLAVQSSTPLTVDEKSSHDDLGTNLHGDLDGVTLKAAQAFLRSLSPSTF